VNVLIIMPPKKHRTGLKISFKKRSTGRRSSTKRRGKRPASRPSPGGRKTGVRKNPARRPVRIGGLEKMLQKIRDVKGPM